MPNKLTEAVRADRAAPLDRLLIHKVADAMRACPWSANMEALAAACIEAVFEQERCCVCHELMQGPTICDVCAREKTPVAQTERREHRDWIGRAHK